MHKFIVFILFVNLIVQCESFLKLDSFIKTRHSGVRSPAHPTIQSLNTTSLNLTQNENLWPCWDELDRKIITLALPALMNFAIVPIASMFDTLWIGRMSDTLALAGQAAASQVFASASFLTSFLPSVIIPQVAKAAASGNKTTLQARVSESICVGVILGTIGTGFLSSFPNKALSIVLSHKSDTMPYAVSYLSVRALTFIPALVSSVFFAVFRGLMDFTTPLKISLLSNTVGIFLGPFLIFRMGMGIAGAAAATCVAEIIAFLIYSSILLKREIILFSLFKIPNWSALKPLLLGGMAMQVRSMSMNFAFLNLQQTIQALDKTGTAAAAHAIAMQFWQLGGIILICMSVVATTIIPTVLTNKVSKSTSDTMKDLKFTANRLMMWGVLLGVILAMLQLLSLPLLKLLSPLASISEAARMPSLIGSSMNLINGVIFIGEGIQLGCQSFNALGVSTAIGSAGMVLFLKYFGTSLSNVWTSLLVLNIVRLTNVLIFHFYTSPYSIDNKKHD